MNRKKKIDLFFSICIPVYNGESTLEDTLKSILTQSFDNYEIIICDDYSKDNSKDVIDKIGSSKIKYFRNDKNLGYSPNLEKCRQLSKGDIIYLMGQDDILATDALLNTYNAFKRSDDIGVVTRPYYWFDTDILKPVRAKINLATQGKDVVVRITDPYKKIMTMFATLDQLSGLAYRKKYMDIPFHPDIFPCHVYPFASIFKKHPAVFLKDYNIAVRIASSQTRFVSSIYDKSPLQSWVELFENVYPEDKFKAFRTSMIKNFVATNYVGFVQIKNYAKKGYLLREIRLLVKYRMENLLNPLFWFFSLGTLLIPANILIKLVDWYKKVVNYWLLKCTKTIDFSYNLNYVKKTNSKSA